MAARDLQPECGMREVCELFGLTPRAIRFYEEKGLLQLKRDRLGSRRFSHSDRSRLERVARLRAAGVSLNEIGSLLLAGLDADPDVVRSRMLDALLARLAKLRAQVDQASLLIAELETEADAGQRPTEAPRARRSTFLRKSA